MLVSQRMIRPMLTARWFTGRYFDVKQGKARVAAHCCQESEEQTSRSGSLSGRDRESKTKYWYKEKQCSAYDGSGLE